MIKLAGLLVFCLGALWWYVRNDAAEYAAFKLLTETGERQKRFRWWILKSFMVFFGATMVSLAILGRLGVLIVFPAEFSGLAATVQAALPQPQAVPPGFLVGFGCAVVVGIIAGGLGSKLSKRKATPVVLGDVQALMPRNWTETAWTAGLSINAGLCEELFFRLLLPLLLAGLFGNAAFAFGLAAVVFGLVHFYQGAVGIIATTILGAVLTGIYLWTGNIWIAVGVHVFLDLLNLVVRPTLGRLMKAHG